MSTLVSDLLGVSARRMLHAIAAGETDPAVWRPWRGPAFALNPIWKSLRCSWNTARVRSDFDRTLGILGWRFLAVGGVLVSAMLTGTVGFFLVEGWPLFDAFYMALMTLTTVGYGEVHPLSFHGRVFASFLMLVGVATVFVSFAILGDTLLRLELADYFGHRRRTRMLQHIAGHTSSAALAA